MKGNAEVIAAVNGLLADEFCAIHSYILHAEMCENWGYTRLASLIRKDAIEEMGHAEKHLERILFFEGEADVYTIERKPVPKTVQEILQIEHGMEMEAIAAYNRGIETARKAGDAGTREYLEHILQDEEHHELFLRSQLNLMETVGAQNYLAEQVKKSEESK